MDQVRTTIRTILAEDDASSGKYLKDFCPCQLAAGIAVEMEHTDDTLEAQQIVLDHLREDEHYYGKVLPPEEIKTALQSVYKSIVDASKMSESIGMSGLSGDNPGTALNVGQPPSYKPATPDSKPSSGDTKKKRKKKRS